MTAWQCDFRARGTHHALDRQSRRRRQHFTYFAGHGSDTITDFTDGEDVIDLSALEAISGFEDLSMVQFGSFVTIDPHAHGGRTTALENFDIEDLDETDFIFYQPPESAQAAP